MLNSLMAPVLGEMQKHLVNVPQSSLVKVERPCEPSHSNLSVLKKGISFVILKVVAGGLLIALNVVGQSVVDLIQSSVVIDR